VVRVAKVLILGAGVVGLGTAALLAKDGHDVVVLERDAASDDDLSATTAWAEWQRRGVNQFRLPHFFLARYHAILESELPEVKASILEAGGLAANPFLDIPEALRGPTQPGDEDFQVLTGRRPVMEFAIARAVEAIPGVEVRRGVTVEALETGPAAHPGVTHVVGVRTAEGEVLRADLVVDCMGRRSPLPSLLEAAGARRPAEELDDSGFIYYARHFTSGDGTVPFALGPALIPIGSITSLTLAADNGTWGVVLVAASKDRALLGLRDVDRWTTVVKSLPLAAHWLEGTPLDEGVTSMTKIEDRLRTFVVDGEPVATGVVAVGDAWSCSNPTLGRGASIGTMHAITLRDTLRKSDADDPSALVLAFHEHTSDEVLPWFERTRRSDRHRLEEIDAAVRGEAYEPGDDEWELEQAVAAGSGQDPDLLRAALRANFVLAPLSETVDGALAARASSLAAGSKDAPLLGPSRDELVAMAAG
jgi:2-polyprenyl-6-methoxyphenol hydroxylase-like FAD-dependent oxidoreductase